MQRGRGDKSGKVSVIQILILNVIGSRNHFLKKTKFIMHSLKGTSGIKLYTHPGESEEDKVNLQD